MVRAMMTVGLSPPLASRRERVVDLVEVVAVDDDRPASEGLDAVLVDVEVPLVLGGPALAEAVDVEDGGEVREAVVTGLVERLPDGALGELAVAAEHPDVERQLVEVLARRARRRPRSAMPCPSDPVATSTQGIKGVG